MYRRGIAVGVLMILLWTGLVRAEPAKCYYDPKDMVSYGCSKEEFRVILAKIRMDAALGQHDWDAYADAWRDARAIILERPGLSVSLDKPLSSYQVVDSLYIGPNVKVTTLPGNVLVWQDRHERPLKIAGQHTQRKGGKIANFLLAFAAGYAVGAWVEWAAWGTYTTWVEVGDGAIGIAWSAASSSIPEDGETEYLLHLLHALSDGKEQVYRANLRVKPDGKIQLVAPWKLLGYRTPGGDW